MSTADAILARLDKVRQTAGNRWMACCPAHEDRDPSLSIRKLPNGRVLIHDFGGCQTEEILDAISLDWRALFPEQERQTPSCRPAWQAKFSPAELLAIISEETSVAAMLAADFLAGRVITEADWQRLATAASRIGRARDHACAVTVTRLRYPAYGR